MKTYQITVELPDELLSLHQLELLVNTEGEKVKQLLFEKALATMVEKQKIDTSSQPLCPDCQKKSRSFVVVTEKDN